MNFNMLKPRELLEATLSADERDKMEQEVVKNLRSIWPSVLNGDLCTENLTNNKPTQ